MEVRLLLLGEGSAASKGPETGVQEESTLL